jgi:integral membrane protein
MHSIVIRQLRIVGLAEGVSFLLLLGVAMPLKYLAGLPMAVRIVGMAHGVLFIIYVLALVHAQMTVGWPVRRVLALMLAAILPAGTFVMDGRLRAEQLRAEAAAGR